MNIRGIILKLVLLVWLSDGYSQTYLSDLEWAPGQGYLIGSGVNGEPIYIHEDSVSSDALVQILNPTDTTLNFLNTKDGVVEVVWSVDDFIITGDMTPTFYRSGDTLCITNGADNMWSCVDVREFESLDVSDYDEIVLTGVDTWSPTVDEFKDNEKNHTLTMNGVVMKKVVTPSHINEYKITGSTIFFYENLNNDRVVYRSH